MENSCVSNSLSKAKQLAKLEADNTKQVMARHMRTVRNFFHSLANGTLSISSITPTAKMLEPENKVMVYRVIKSDIMLLLISMLMSETTIRRTCVIMAG